MSDIVSNARSARESLAKGLNLLQSNPTAPPEYLQAAEPIAKAMGALHRIETMGGPVLKTSATEALEAVRSALSILQSKAAMDPQMMQTMEAVASSLGTIFGLTKSAEAEAAPSPQAPVHQAPPQPVVAQPPMHQAAPYQPPPQPPAFQPSPQAPYQPPVPQAPPYQPPPQPVAFQPSPQAPYQPPVPQAPPYQPPPQPAFFQPPPQVPQFQAPSAPMAAVGPANASPKVAAAPMPAAASSWSEADPFAAKPAVPTAEPYRGAANLPSIEAELGTHSATNFYRGLSGNDVVDHGGLFIATYNVPAVGQTLKVQVSLPGGYEFEAIGIVRWTRESRESMTSDATSPGCGIQFTHISTEARQLVYRYVRNREPLFHDDL
ncbi:MAG: IgA FC receptor precursor [Deltaproteobacteria bacterium ADurb.Bin207]|nr:MAG: IgA FC receptor precursor [Deltaproteobacteria bacterium ADurb.Bin207]